MSVNHSANPVGQQHGDNCTREDNQSGLGWCQGVQMGQNLWQQEQSREVVDVGNDPERAEHHIFFVFEQGWLNKWISRTANP
ncbi:hypothetical protein D3C76_1691460 [compost metagenome]